MGSGIPLQATQWGIDVKESTRSNIYEANGSLPLGDVDLFTLVEGIDPLAIVATDAAAAARLARAYRQNIPVDEACRIFCRNGVAFRDLEGMLETPEGKQRAWALFKKLPRLGK